MTKKLMLLTIGMVEPSVKLTSKFKDGFDVLVEAKGVFSGNNMATKNQIAHELWIIQAIRMPQVKLSKQNCLD